MKRASGCSYLVSFSLQGGGERGVDCGAGVLACIDIPSPCVSYTALSSRFARSLSSRCIAGRRPVTYSVSFPVIAATFILFPSSHAAASAVFSPFLLCCLSSCRILHFFFPGLCLSDPLFLAEHIIDITY